MPRPEEIKRCVNYVILSCMCASTTLTSSSTRQAALSILTIYIYIVRSRTGTMIKPILIILDGLHISSEPKREIKTTQLDKNHKNPPSVVPNAPKYPVSPKYTKLNSSLAALRSQQRCEERPQRTKPLGGLLQEENGLKATETTSTRLLDYCTHVQFATSSNPLCSVEAGC